MTTENEVDSFFKVAVHAATEAGKILKQGFDTPFEIDYKDSKNNLVTEYDKKSENFIIQYIKSHFPQHGFIAEESGSEKSKAEYIWVIDPLDGTSNFARGIPVFSVSIALFHNFTPIIGVVYQPLTDELFTAIKGKGAFLNGKPLKVSWAKDLSESFIATGFPYNVQDNPGKCMETLIHILKFGAPVRRLGSAAIDLAYLAAGKFDAFYEVSLQPWDYGAGMLLVQEAGGIVSNYEGTPLNTLKPESCIAANPQLYHSLIREINIGKQ